MSLSTRPFQTKRPNRWREAFRGRPVLRYGLYLGYLAILCWLGSSLFWTIRLNGSRERHLNDEVWMYYYPELWDTGAIKAQPSLDDQRIDVLLLGGSVLEQVGDQLQERLQAATDWPLRVFNLARSAHTTRDSYFKYARLTGQSFDWVVIYHGMNDIRMNYVPADEFRDDYSHCGWYAGLTRRLEAGHLTIVDVVSDTSLTANGEPDPDTLSYGQVIKTAGPLKHNLKLICDAAHTQRSRVLLMTFASYFPADYSRDRFDRGELDYGPGKYSTPAELWGAANHVQAGLVRHNQAIRDLARVSDVSFLDMAHLLPGSGRNFSDPCHLTQAGCDSFAAHVAASIQSGTPANVFLKGDTANHKDRADEPADAPGNSKLTPVVSATQPN